MRSHWSLCIFSLLLVFKLLSATVVEDAKDAFTCSGKIIGGYYADVQKNCQSFHVCTIGEKGKITDIIFKCVEGTVFDQETRVCERKEEVDCSRTLSFYHLNDELYGPDTIPHTSNEPAVLTPFEAPMGAGSNLKDSSPTPNTNIAALTTNPTITNYWHASDPRETFSNVPPFTVTRTVSSSSISASTHVQIKTPISRFSLRQGINYDQPDLPAPHLRPSLLKLAAARSAAARKRHVRSAATEFGSPARTSYLSDRLRAINTFRFLFFKPLYRGGRISPATVTPNDIQTPDLCRGLKNNALVSAPNSDCEEFYMCISTKDHQMIARKFRCVQEGYTFNFVTGTCSPTNQECIKSRISLKNKQIVDPIHVCSSMPGVAYVLDLLSNCEQYFQCPEDDRSVIHTFGCQHGYLFSQKEEMCVKSNQITCQASKSELLLYLNLSNLLVYKSDINEIVKWKLLKRHKRNVLLHVNPKDISRSGLTKMASIIGGPIIPQSNAHDITNLSPVFKQTPRLVDSMKPNVLKEDTRSKSRVTIKKNVILKIPTAHLTVTEKNGTIFEQTETKDLKISSIRPKVTHTGNGNGNNVAKEVENILEMNVTILEIPDDNNTMEDTVLNEDISTVIDETTSITTETYNETETQSEMEETTVPAETTIIIETTESTTVTTSQTTTPISTTEPIKVTQQIKTTTTKSSVEKTATNVEKTVATNFTCKDKELEQFYPDADNNCTIFHYCSPGFTDNEVLDLTFICSGDTGFDIVTKKCENISIANCGSTATPTDESATSATPVNITSKPTTIIGSTGTTESKTTKGSKITVGSTTATESSSTAGSTSTKDLSRTMSPVTTEFTVSPTSDSSSPSQSENDGSSIATDQTIEGDLSTTGASEATQTSKIEPTTLESLITLRLSSIDNESMTTLVDDLATGSASSEQLSQMDKIT